MNKERLIQAASVFGFSAITGLTAASTYVPRKTPRKEI